MAAKTGATGELTFEQALARLEQIVEQLESGGADLEESIKIYEEGMKLKTRCEAKLEEARLRVEKIVTGPDGAAATEPAPELAADPAGRGRK